MPQVSARREQRMQKIQARGPLQDFAKQFPCVLCRGVFFITPMHVEQRVGKGYGDWALSTNHGVARWEGRIAPGCETCHARYDDNVVGRRKVSPTQEVAVKEAGRLIGERWAEAVGVDLGAAMHPYDQHRMKGSPEPGDVF